MKIYCTGCQKDVEARLTDGAEIYPHRPDLYKLPIWKCDTCGNYVGCHHKTANPTRPLGVIATPEISNARKKIHALLDSIWESRLMGRSQVYAYISHQLGHDYHNGEIRTLEEARQIYRIVGTLRNELLKADEQKE